MKIQLSQKQIEITNRILECQFCQTTEEKMKWAKNEIAIYCNKESGEVEIKLQLIFCLKHDPAIEL